MRTSIRVVVSFLVLFCWTALAQKPTRTILVLGHADHGKSTLTSAITGVLSDLGTSRFVPYERVADPSEITIQGMRVAAARVEYETEKHHYTHIDCKSPEDLAALLKLESLNVDGAIVVVSAVDGPMPQTREQLRLAHERGIEAVVVYINKIDVADAEVLDLVETETRELLTAIGYEGEEVPIVRGSALMALTRSRPDIGEESILKLLRMIDVTIGYGRPAPSPQ